MRFSTICLSILLVLFVFSSCSKKKTSVKSVVESGYSEYISSYTTGVISCKAPIKISFTKEPVNLKQPGEILSNKLITLTPSVKGKTQWLDNQTLAFIPTEKMISNTRYTVKVELDKIIEVPKKYKTLEFDFKTIRQSFNVNNLVIKPFGDKGLKYQLLAGKIHTADFANNEQVEALIKVSLEKQSLNISWEHDEDGKTHVFKTDSIERLEQAQKLVVKWDGDRLGVNQKGSEELEVPSLDVFKLLSHSVIQQPEQHLLLRFSDPLLPDQNLNGLISIGNKTNLRSSIDNNEIRVYLPSRLSGEHEIYISGGIRNANDFKLKEPLKILAPFEDLKPAVRLAGKGNIIPAAEELIFPFEAVNLKAVDLRIIKVFTNNIHQFFQRNNYNKSYEIKRVGKLIYQDKIDLNVSSFSELKNWNTYSVDIAKLVKIEPGAIYRVQVRFRKKYSLYRKNEMPEIEANSLLNEIDELKKKQDELESWNEPGWYSDYYYPENYEWSQRDNPEHVSYYYSDRFVTKNLFATNLGIIAKGGNNNAMNFVVTNLKTTEPEQGVSLKIYNYQKQLMESITTGAEGMVSVKLKHKPFLLVAEKTGQKAYLKLDDGSSLSLSNFDVTGNIVQKGIKGYIYGERGVWRPGDKIYLTFILEDKQQNLPEGHPIILELVNPKGQTVLRQAKTEGTNAFYCFTIETKPDDPTGNWRAYLKVGGQTFSKRIKVETVKPNRLKIDLKFANDLLSITNATEKATLKSNWLHGATAKNLKADISINFSKAKTKFKGYFNYIFDDPAKEFYSEDKVVFEGKLNEQGISSLAFKLPKLTSAPGMLKANFTTRVFEETGDFSTDVQSIPFSPYSSYVGLKLPANKSNWYKTDTPYKLNILTVGPNGKTTDRKNIEITVYKISWRWWWDSDEDNLAHYVNDRYSRPVSREKVSTTNGVSEIPFEIKYKNWDSSGRYLIHVKDLDSGHSSGVTAYFSKWGSWSSEGMQGAATMLSFKTDKEKYNVGEKASVTIPSGKNGKALVSIENGSDVLDMFWVETREKNTQFEFEIKPGMTPNIFVNISLIQPHLQTENDAPIRLYGVVPVLVEDPVTHIKPQLEIPDELEPEKEYQVEVSEKSGREMTYTIAVVDEGLLDLTRFKTPNPWPVFYAREALGVKTWDFYDDVIGAYGARLERAFAIGGDENLDAAKKKKANRFKPVVTFLGPFKLEAGARNSHNLKMPNYVGAVRAMVVAGQDGAYGNTEKSVKVLKPLMILPTLPRVLGPGEEVELPVNVFAMKPEVKDVKLEIERNEMFTAVNSTSQKISFEEPGDQIAGFKLKVAEKTGVAKLKVKAKSGKHTAYYEIELAVRPSNPIVTNFTESVIEPGKKWETTAQEVGMEGTNSAKLELSGIPPLNLSQRLNYLIGYPHGCIEQVTSGAFPQLMLHKLVELTADQKYEIEENVQTALNKFTRFQITNGAFVYWPGSQHLSSWGTNYAGHFMLKAEEAGYFIPYGMKDKWISYQQNRARNWQRSSTGYSPSGHVQAYLLYTLALAQKPNFGAMNRLREEGNLSNLTKWRLAGAYALAGQPEVAEKIIRNLSKEVKEYRELSGTFGSHIRDKSMIVETLALLKKRSEAFGLVEEISSSLSSNKWLSTQTTAYSLLAISQFIGDDNSGDNTLKAEVTISGSSKTISSLKPLWQEEIQLKKNGTKVHVENKSGKILYARVISQGIPVTGDSTAVKSNLNMDVRYTDMKGNRIDPLKIQQGTDFAVEISLHNPGLKGTYEEMALTSIFPSGWEIINKRINDIDSPLKSDEFDFQDIKDDRVYTYFNLKPNERKTFRLLLNAAYLGKYYLPSVSCEAMYDNRINARVPGKWVEVAN